MSRKEKRNKKHIEKKIILQKWQEFCMVFGFMSSPEYINAQRRFLRRVKKSA